MFPYYLYTDPQAARNLLLYRYHLLPAAKEKARARFMAGPCSPWCSADDGSEQCETWEYGDCEIHNTADVAYAFDQYIKATGDMGFSMTMPPRLYIGPLASGLNASILTRAPTAMSFVAVKGPDEYCAITNNNMFTNFMAAHNLRLAAEAARHYAQGAA